MKYQDTFRFETLEELNSAPHGWDTKIAPLSGQSVAASLAVSRSQQMLLGTVSLNGSTLQQGSSPKGMRTFSLVGEHSESHTFRGHNVDRSTLIIFPRDRELHAVSTGAMSITNISISESILQAAIDSLELPPSVIDDLQETVEISQVHRQRLDQQITSLVRFLGDSGTQQQRAQFNEVAEEALISSVLDSILEVALAGRPVSINKRYRYLRKALDYLHAHRCDPVSVGGLATSIGTSRRTLELSFREILQISPADFIKRSRLEGCRRELLACRREGSSSVSATANQWGFWHLSQFAADYQQRFGELPSETLRP